MPTTALLKLERTIPTLDAMILLQGCYNWQQECLLRRRFAELAWLVARWFHLR